MKAGGDEPHRRRRIGVGRRKLQRQFVDEIFVDLHRRGGLVLAYDLEIFTGVNRRLLSASPSDQKTRNGILNGNSYDDLTIIGEAINSNDKAARKNYFLNISSDSPNLTN